MLDIADTSIRLYRKQDGTVSVHLHSCIMIHAKSQGYLLSAYLNQFDCSVTLDTGEYIKLDNYRYTYDCLYSMNHMIYELWASGLTGLEVIKDAAGLLRIEYHLFSFPGQCAPNVIEKVVPVLARGSYVQRYSSDPSKWR